MSRQSKDLSYHQPLPNTIRVNPESDTVAHFFTLDQLSQVFDTHLENGLTEEKAKQMMASYGMNVIEGRKDNPLLSIFLRNMFGWFPAFLWIGGFLSILVHFIQYSIDTSDFSNENLYLGIIILLVVIFTGLFGFYEEAKNVKVMKGFENMMAMHAKVIRDGERKFIPSSQLVIGDLIDMNSGEIVPADVRLIDVNGFSIDMSAITGEAKSQSRTIYYTNENPLKTKNLAFSSCKINEGSAKGIVVAIGNHTVIGKIAGLVKTLVKEEAPVAYEIKHFIKLLCIIAFILGILFFFMVAYIHSNWMIGFYYMIGIIVANVPEGLLVTMTVAFTLTALKLKKKKCLSKKLESVETLGAISVICSDKTGTITRNQMSVSHICFDFEIFKYDDKLAKRNRLYETIIFAACMSLRAEFVEFSSEDNKVERKIIGDATEVAILRYTAANCSVTSIRKNNPKLFEIPFTSKSKYQLSIHELKKNKNNRYLVMKGAPDVIFCSCKTILLSSGNIQITEEIEVMVRKLIITLGNMGERVIGYCDLLLPSDKYPQNFKYDSTIQNYPMNGYRFLGLLSLIDPPRKSVADSIAKCRSAGIKVVMVTGDHPITALAISRKVGIISEKNETLFDAAFKVGADPKIYRKTADLTKFKAAVVKGDELRTMSPDQLDNLLIKMEEITFARTTPQQKLMIVESFQRIGHVVAVTGDGVNDAPALKKANIGIAMGITGTDVSKEAADMILLDDNFSSIVLGIEEGRLIYDNLKKSIAFILTSNIPEVMPFLLYATLGIPLPLHALLIIAINIFTDLWPAISFAYEKAEADIMNRSPRTLSDRLVTRQLIMMAYFQVGLLQTAAAMTGYFFIFDFYGFHPSDLFFTRQKWDDKNINDYQDSLGQEWTYADRKKLEILAQTAYYVCMVVVQIADCIICKTRRLSIIKQGMSNHMLNLGILAEISISLLIVYVPAFNHILITSPVPLIIWLIPIPYGIILILVDELRRFLIRKYPGGWIERELYF